MNHSYDFKVGDVVVFTPNSKDWEYFQRAPEFYPKPGTMGTIAYLTGGGDVGVQWEKGSTSGNDIWFCARRCLTLSNNMEPGNSDIEFDFRNIADFLL